MIAAPLNDQDCLGRLTEVAAAGQSRAELRDLAARFRSTAALAAWIRELPQRDDHGDPADGPRVDCEVTQRARLLAEDPNCVERSILYLAAAELIDPEPVRQLATIETPSGRHTFPVENGEPVVLDAGLSRNGLRAGVWLIRNGGQEPPVALAAESDPYRLLAWMVDLAEEIAEQRDGAKGRLRVDRSRAVFGALLDGRSVSPGERSDALYTLRMAGEAAPMYGQTGLVGFRIARATIARLVARQTRRNLKINRERAIYWGGKALATYYGVGSLYDPAYQEVAKRQARKKTGAASRRQGLCRCESRRMPGSLYALERKG